MAELDTLFSWFCGQWTDHTWRPGGIPLPFCQRCTGLYLGALLAITLQIVFRRPLSRRRLWIDSLLLLQMVPFGYHWLPQDATIRTLAGFLFAFGLIGFLWRLPAKVWPTWKTLTVNGCLKDSHRIRCLSRPPLSPAWIDLLRRIRLSMSFVAGERSARQKATTKTSSGCERLSSEVASLEGMGGSCNKPPPPEFLRLPPALAALGFALLLAGVHRGDRTAAYGLSVLGFLGWLVLVLLISLNAALLCQSLVQKARLSIRSPRDTSRPAP